MALPSWLVIVLVYIYVALAAYNTEYMTLPLESVETVIDEAADVKTITPAKGRGKRGAERERERERGVGDWKELWSQGTDGVMDVPLGGVCEVLYGEFREGDKDEDKETA